MDPDPVNTDPKKMSAVFRIHYILVWIRIPGSGSAYPCLWLMDPDSDPAIFVTDFQDANKKYLYPFFKDKKSKRSHKRVGIKVLLTIFAWWWKDPDPDSYFWIMDPDPGSPKTCGSGGSGTLDVCNPSWNLFLSWPSLVRKMHQNSVFSLTGSPVSACEWAVPGRDTLMYCSNLNP